MFHGLSMFPQTKLDLNPRVEMVLQKCPLGTRSNVQDCVVAAQTLQRALNQELSQGVSILQAVTDQRAFFSNLSFAFGKRLQESLTFHNVSDWLIVVSHIIVFTDVGNYTDRECSCSACKQSYLGKSQSSSY